MSLKDIILVIYILGCVDSVKLIGAEGGIGVTCSNFSLGFCIHSRIHELEEAMITSDMLDLNGRAD